MLNLKFRNNEKKKNSLLLLCALALSWVVAGCSSETLFEDNEITTTESNSYKMRTSNSLVDLILEINENLEYPTFATTSSIITTVEEEALKNRQFIELILQGYTTPTSSEWDYINNTDKTTFLNGLSYSLEAKSFLYTILNNNSTSDNFYENSNLSAPEKTLLEACKILSTQDIGDNGDNDKVRRIVAFAYGYQTSTANAVVMALISTVQP